LIVAERQSGDAFDCRVLWWPPSAMLFSLDSGTAPVAVDIHFEDGCVVNETVHGCERHRWIAERFMMLLS
jgi:hypothetical protein